MKRIAPFLFVAVAALALGWFLRPMHDGSGHGVRPADEGQDGRRPLFYQSAMHPWIKSEKPGKCTVCGMDLTPVYANTGESDSGAGIVTLASASEKAVDVRTSEAKRVRISRTLRFAGTLLEDDTRRRFLSAPMDGRVDQLFFSYAGQEVESGQPLASLSGQTLMMAVRSHLMFRSQSTKAPPDETTQNLRNSARMRLRQLGMSDLKIDQLPAVIGEESMGLEILAPSAGTIVNKLVNEGQHVKEGDRLYELADLGSIWFRFEAYENDLPWIRAGQKVFVTAPTAPGQTFMGEIGFLEPKSDERTRSVKVTVELSNPRIRAGAGMRRALAPGAFAQCRVVAEGPPALAIPRTAVINTGGDPCVYVRLAAGSYGRRHVALGAVGDDVVQVVEGLGEGEQVVVSGGMMVDAQAQFSGAIPAGSGRPTGIEPAPSPDHSAVGLARRNGERGAALDPVFKAASELASALAADDLTLFNARSTGLRKLVLDASNAVAADIELTRHASAALEAALWPKAASLAQARQRFHAFVTPVVALATSSPKQRNPAGGVRIYRCSMTKGVFPAAPAESLWLQTSGPMRNPYHGRPMIDCGAEVLP